MKIAPSMDIYTPKHTWVVFTNKNGYEGQREHARSTGLVEGHKYQVSYIDIHSSSSYVTFAGIIGSFNSVMFASIEDYEDYIAEDSQLNLDLSDMVKHQE